MIFTKRSRITLLLFGIAAALSLVLPFTLAQKVKPVGVSTSAASDGKLNVQVLYCTS